MPLFQQLQAKKSECDIYGGSTRPFKRLRLRVARCRLEPEFKPPQSKLSSVLIKDSAVGNLPEEGRVSSDTELPGGLSFRVLSLFGLLMRRRPFGVAGSN